MKIDIDKENNLRLKEIFTGILLETEEGNQIGVCMRDDTIEINVCPSGVNSNNWWRINMQTGQIEPMIDRVIQISQKDGDKQMKESMITVCDKCLRASCRRGIFYCDKYRDAGTVEMSVEELKKLDLEHPSYWEL